MRKRGVVANLDGRTLRFLRVMGFEPKQVEWNVNLEGKILDKPLLTFTFPAESEGELQADLAALGIKLVVLDVNPVSKYVVDPKELGNKYVIVKWMPPREKAIGIVDTDDTEFVTLIDFSTLEGGDQMMANSELIDSVVNAMKFAAHELNRLNDDLVASKEDTPNVL